MSRWGCQMCGSQCDAQCGLQCQHARVHAHGGRESCSVDAWVFYGCLLGSFLKTLAPLQHQVNRYAPWVVGCAG